MRNIIKHPFINLIFFVALFAFQAVRMKWNQISPETAIFPPTARPSPSAPRQAASKPRHSPEAAPPPAPR